MNFLELKYIDCATASDGASLCLILRDDETNKFCLILNRAIGTNTLNKLFYYQKQLLFFLEEEKLRPYLQKLAVKSSIERSR